MANVSPFFITGAAAKVVLNGHTMAFCTDVSYSVAILTQTPKVLGMYEGSSVEPLGYSVSGSFTVIRYAKGAQQVAGSRNIPNDVAANDAGNGVGNWGAVWSNSNIAAIVGTPFSSNDGRANEALDPSTYQNGTTFDIQIYQKVNNGTSPGTIGVANIRSARITQADFTTSKKGLAVQRFNFVALYADEDAFYANFSGQGQQF
jgi:hypothetical protein